MLSMRVIIHEGVKYEGTREETEQMMVMFHGLMMYIIYDCHFQRNINTRYCINKIMDYLKKLNMNSGPEDPKPPP